MSQHLAPALIANCVVAPAGHAEDEPYALYSPFHHAAVVNHARQLSAPSNMISPCSAEQVEAALQFAHSVSAASPWCSFKRLEERYEILKKCAAAIGADAELQQYAALDTHDTGIPLPVELQIVGGLQPAALATLECAMEELRVRQRVKGRYGDLIGVRHAVGVVGIIAPYNVPAGTIISKLVTAILCGCPVIVKPSAVAARALTQMLLTMHRVMLEHGSSIGDIDSGNSTETCATPTTAASAAMNTMASLLQVVQGSAAVGTQICASPLVKAIQFTGAPATAQKVVRAAGMKPALLECGGSNAIVITDKVDLVSAVRYTCQALLTLNGQWCLGCSRIFVHRNIAGAFLAALKRYMRRRVRVFFAPDATEGLAHCNAMDAAASPPGSPTFPVADSNGGGGGMNSREPSSAAPAVVIELGPVCSAHAGDACRAAMKELAATAAAKKRRQQNQQEQNDKAGENDDDLSEHILTLVDIDAIWRSRQLQQEQDVSASATAAAAAVPSSAPPAFVSPALVLEPDIQKSAQREFFAPVSSFHTYETECEVVNAVNLATGMLGAAVFAETEAAGVRLASRIRNASFVFVNSYNFAHALNDGDGELPVTFAGSSGLGRDGNGRVLAEFFSRTSFVGCSGDNSDHSGHADDDDDIVDD